MPVETSSKNLKFNRNHTLTDKFICHIIVLTLFINDFKMEGAGLA